MPALHATGSIVLFISQLHDNPASRFGEQKVAGGHALKYYATGDVWSSIYKPLYKEVNGRKREIGNQVKFGFKKNRITGRSHSLLLDIYPDVGFDDLGSCIDFLVEEGWWTKSGQTIDAKGLNIQATRDKLIRVIEQNNRENDLRDICGKCWAEIEAACTVKRKNRYIEPAKPEIQTATVSAINNNVKPKT
jgi:hypothetical protein